jgi:pyruvyl transferase EpsO
LKNEKRIAGLKAQIDQALLPLIDDDYSLLDVPNYNNIGDSLIYEGELTLLKNVPHKRKFSGCRKFVRLKDIPEKGIILMQGGGNFGDLWRVFQEFRLNIIKNRIDQKIIIFPQTVHYQHKENLLNDAAIFNLHPNLTICARDQTSYEILKEYFCNNQILLVPDMAFYLNLNHFISSEPTGKVLLLQRIDKELRNADVISQNKLDTRDKLKQLVQSDWPGIDYTQAEKRKWKRKVNMNKYYTRALLFLGRSPQKLNLDFGELNLFESSRQLEKGVAFINQFDAIYSTRLHGAILSILLGKPVYILDNSYGKNSSFYNCWLQDFEDCEMLD